jgi:hypothetical protein
VTQEQRGGERAWYHGAVTGYLTQAEYAVALAQYEKTGEPVHVLICSDREAEAG